jgi:mitochondrial fission protein ELM1
MMGCTTRRSNRTWPQQLAVHLVNHELHEAGRVLFQLPRRRAAILQAILHSRVNHHPPHFWNSVDRSPLRLVFGG